MRLPAKYVAWLLPLFLAGCIHKNQVAQNQPLAPAIEDPLPVPVPSPTELPPPEVTVPSQPAPAPAPPPEPPKKTPKHKKPQNTTDQALNSATVSAIGQLSSGDPPDLRQQTDRLIEGTERALNGINRTLSDQETKTAAQIREFLKQARAALTSGDVDGAHILALKAQVLLDELRK